MAKVCETCRTTDVSTECALCQNTLCEDCVLEPPSGSFSLLVKIPDELSHRIYCRFCYDAKVEPAIVEYEEIKTRAEDVFIFFTSQRKEIPLIKKSKESFKVIDGVDRDETIMKLAYLAAEKKFNAVVDTEVIYEKVRNHGYQTTRWSGTGIPAQVDSDKMDRQALRDKMYR